MSLLLDARKKNQLAQSAQGGNGNHSGGKASIELQADSAHPTSSAAPSSDVNNPVHGARISGKNLFNAKSRSPLKALAGINRTLLIALVGTFILLTIGAIYVWYSVSAGNTQQLRPVSKPPVTSIERPQLAATAPQNIQALEKVPPQADSSKPIVTPKPARSIKPAAKAIRPQKKQPVLVEQHHDEPIDPLLNDAYQAYRSGKFEQAQQQYLKVVGLDSKNIDALLGLAVIAQRRGEENLAAQYYAKVMTLDPRNAVANAGMSALTTGENRESRLKTLLNEQQNSSSLHFALGNYYAGEARWADAQQSYFKAYKLDPDNAELAFNLAVSLDHLGQKKPAAQYYQNALQLDYGNHAGFDHAETSLRIKELTK